MKKFFVLLAFVFFACSEVPLKLDAAESTVVFDFEEDVKQNLSVWVKLSSDVKRIDFFKIEHIETGYEWNIYDSSTLNVTRNKVGYCNFVMPGEKKILQGNYVLTVGDKTQNEKTYNFAVFYDSSLFEKNVSDFPKTLGENSIENLAVYAKDGDLLYYGKRKNDWKTEDVIWSEIKDSEKIRVCYSNQNKTVLCIMPPVFKK